MTELLQTLFPIFTKKTPELKLSENFIKTCQIIAPFKFYTNTFSLNYTIINDQCTAYFQFTTCKSLSRS